MNLKIAYCIPSVYIVGGMERTLALKANYLADVLGYSIFIILTDGKDKQPAFHFSEKIDLIYLDLNYDKIQGYPFCKKAILYSTRQRLFKKRLSETLGKIKPDITISMMRREINFITGLKDGSKKVGEIHLNRGNFRDFNTGGHYKWIKSFMAKIWMHQLLKKIRNLDKFVVLSNEDKENWPEIDNISVIYNAIPKFPEKFSYCTSRNVVAAGRFVRQKGFDLLIDSWKIVSGRHPDWTLSIYGSGDKEAFHKLVAKNNLTENCLLCDAVNDLSDKFAESSIFAFSSRFEGFGMVITEAMACGVPPVAFACPCGPKDIIHDGIDGLLVEPGNIETFAEKLCYLIENDEIRREMGRQARFSSERFRIETIANEWDSLFRSLTNTDKTT